MQNQQSNTSTTKPLVTFIVCYYNLPVDMLRQCLDSIMAVTLRSSEREIIVVDDGSAESPLTALKPYWHDIIYVRQHNGGLSSARNRGLLMATGEYLQFVDGDDYLLKKPYEHCLDIVRYQRPDVVMFDFTTADAPSQEATFATSDMESGARYMSQHNLQATACCYLFRRNIVGSLRFTPGICHEDEEFTPQLLLRAEYLLSTDAQAYYYRRRDHSITNDDDWRQVIRRLNDKQLVLRRLSRIADTLPATERQALQRRVAQLTMDYIYNIITQTRSRHYLERKLSLLRQAGLFPLPDKDYTAKYKWFRLMTNSPMGLTVLLNTLPLLKAER